MLWTSQLSLKPSSLDISTFVQNARGGPENVIHASDTIQTQQDILRNTRICAYTYMHAIPINESGHVFEQQ